MTQVAFILCAGKGERWNGNTLKQLTPIGGKPLLLRTVQQLHDRGFRPIVVAWRPEFRTYPDYELIEAKTDPLLETERFASQLWDSHESVLHVYGDVYFTDAAMDLMSREARPLACFARLGAKPQGRFVRWNEIFAWRINREGQERYREALDIAVGALGNQVLIGGVSGWLAFASLMGQSPELLRNAVASYRVEKRMAYLNAVQRVKTNDFYVKIDDATDDWDYNERFNQWRQAWKIS